MSNPNTTNVMFVTDTLYTLANGGAARIYATDDNPADGTTGPGGSGSNSLSYTINSVVDATINFAMTPLNPLCTLALTNIASTGNAVTPSMGPQGWSANVQALATDTLTLTYYVQNSATAYTASVSVTFA